MKKEICPCGCGQEMVEEIYKLDENDGKYYQWDKKKKDFYYPKLELDEKGYEQFLKF